MNEKQKAQISVTTGFSSDLPGSYRKISFILILLVVAIGLAAITGWVFHFDVLNRIKPGWIAMKLFVAGCFELSCIAFILIHIRSRWDHKKILPLVLAATVCLVGLLTIIVDLYSTWSGHESSLTRVPWFEFFLAPDKRMPFLSAFNFLLIGSVLLLLTKRNNLAYSIAHALIIPVTLISYLVPVSYIIGVYSLDTVHQIPIALNSGIAFLLLSVAVLISKHDSWLMKVFTAQETGSVFFRKILPALITLPIIIGWLRITGEHKNVFTSEEGVALVAITYITSFLIFTWLAAHSVNQIDRKKIASDEALKSAYVDLDQKIKERTQELTQMNKVLDAEITERNQAQKILIAEQKRFNDLVELLPAYLILLTPDYHVSYANRFFRERFGENKDKKRCFEYLFDRSEPCEVCHTFRTLKENRPITWEWVGPDGRNYSIYDFPFTDSDGSPRIMEMGLDVTELKNAEATLININAELENRVRARTDELLLSENRYHSLFRNMIEAFAFHEIILDDKGKPCDYRFLDVNPSFEKLTGLNAENVIGKRLSEVLPTAEKYWTEIYGKVAMSGENIDFENFSSGLNKYFRVSAFCPQKGHFAVIFEDITERILAEKELQSTKNYLENLINYANAPIIVWNTESEIMLFNHAFEHLSGYQSEEVLGKKLDFLFPSDSLKESTQNIRYALTKNWETLEIPILTKDSQIRIVLWNSANIYDTDGKNVVAIIAQGNDITERINAEKEVLVSRSKLDLALENASVGIWEWDVVSDKFEWDARMGKILGTDSKQESGTYDYFEKFIHDEDITHFQKAMNNALEKDIPLDTIFRIRKDNNEQNYVSIKALVVKDNTGKPVKMTGACFDINEMKKGAEQAVLKLNDELLRSNRELEQFAYVASHDLQEPLRMVSSFTQLLSMRYKDKLSPEAQEFIGFAVDGALRMQTLINNLLDYSRIETRGKQFMITNMHSIMDQVINNLSTVIKEKSGLVTFDELPEIYADGGQMIQLFQNLISNALKFSDSIPRIHISVNEDPDHFLFSVKDNGIGIEPQYFERIFQIFQRLHSKDAYSGTGIGLAICRRIVERHNGKIWVESVPGEGSVFKLTIRKNK